MADNQLKERKRNQRKANLFPDTECNIRLLIVLFKNRATNKQQNECNRVVSKRRWMGGSELIDVQI